MKTIKVQPLTREAFSKYGSFENLYQPQTMGVGVGTGNAFYPDVLPLDMDNASCLRLSCETPRHGCWQL